MRRRGCRYVATKAPRQCPLMAESGHARFAFAAAHRAYGGNFWFGNGDAAGRVMTMKPCLAAR